MKYFVNTTPEPLGKHARAFFTFHMFNGTLDFRILSNAGIKILKRVRHDSHTDAISTYNATPGCSYLCRGTCLFLSIDLTNFPIWQVTTDLRPTKTVFHRWTLKVHQSEGCLRSTCLLNRWISIPVTIITRKLFAELTLDEISKPSWKS